MKITQVLELIAGNLNNTPSIDSFSSIALNLSNLKRGGLFFAKNAEEIDMAVAMGAYGIVYDKFVQMIDAEIAWIKVEDMQEAIARLIRYFLLHKNIEVFYLKPIEFEIFSQICADNKVLCFDGDLKYLLEQISQDIAYKAVVVSNDSFLNLALDYTRSVVPQQKVLEIHIATLFDMRVYYKLSQYYLLLPSLFFDELSAVVYLCQSYHIDFDLRLFKQLNSVLPSFIDKTPKLLEYGQSERVVIAQDDLKNFRDYAGYIMKNGKWGKMLGFVPKDCSYIFEFPMIIYEDQEDLLQKIAKERFNFGLVYGIGNQALIDLLRRPMMRPMATLF